MLEKRFLKIEIETKDRYCCSPECPFNDCFQYCLLFGENLREYAIRLERCLNTELEEETK